jgi:hypothetical protein
VCTLPSKKEKLFFFFFATDEELRHRPPDPKKESPLLRGTARLAVFFLRLLIRKNIQSCGLAIQLRSICDVFVSKTELLVKKKKTVVSEDDSSPCHPAIEYGGDKGAEKV